jgi:hypothetical protein
MPAITELGTGVGVSLELREQAESSDNAKSMAAAGKASFL